jgi:hypothetical protein
MMWDWVALLEKLLQEKKRGRKTPLHEKLKEKPISLPAQQSA